MSKVLREIYKISNQSTIAGAILMALRSRIEYKMGFQNWIGCKSFPRPRSVLILGQAATGKTSALRHVFDNIGHTWPERPNISMNDGGQSIARWHASAGCSTAVGIREVLRNECNIIHFFDELSIDTSAHVHLLKQIANGEVSSHKHGDTQPFAFNGLILAATNAIKMPPVNQMNHLIACLDRFLIVEAKTPDLTPADYFDEMLAYDDNEVQRPNWEIISAALSSSYSKELNKNELEFARELWHEKAREILDGNSKIHRRNVRVVRDIVTFVKRICRLKNLSESEEAKSFARAMVIDCIHFNPASMFDLSSAERTVYNLVSKGETTYQEIVNVLSMLQDGEGGRNCQRVLRRLMERGIIFRTAYGRYSTRVTLQEAKKKSEECEVVPITNTNKQKLAKVL